MAHDFGHGIMGLVGSGTVDQTVEKLKSILTEKSITLLALIDHSGEAAKAGIEMLPTKLLIFGNPKAGTPVMLAFPEIALDLPLKILVWQDAAGSTRITYNSPAYLQERYGVTPDMMKPLEAVEGLAAAIAG